MEAWEKTVLYVSDVLGGHFCVIETQQLSTCVFSAGSKDDAIATGATPPRTSDTHVIWKHPGHLTSMKNEFGSGTTFLSLWVRAWTSAGRLRRSIARACRLAAVLALRLRAMNHFGLQILGFWAARVCRMKEGVRERGRGSDDRNQEGLKGPDG